MHRESHLRTMVSGEPTLDHQKAALPTHSVVVVLEHREGRRIVTKTTRKRIAEICTGL